MPRFETYATRLLGQGESGSPFPHQLQLNLTNIFVEFIGICQDAIAFFRRGTLWNLLIAAFRPLKDRTAPRLERIRELTYHVDQEAHVATDDLHFARHESNHHEAIAHMTDIRSLLLANTTQTQTQTRDAAMLRANLPFQNLPATRNQSFFGRDAELKELASFVGPDKTPTAQTQVCACLHGLAGSGKTQTALEFAHKYSDAYDAVLWVAAETALKLSESFGSIARRLGLADETVQNAVRLRELVKRWLLAASRAGNHGNGRDGAVRWLLIFDNVSDCSLLETYWPNTGKGTILVTCRSVEIANRLSSFRRDHRPATVKIGPFALETGAEFLRLLVGNQQLEQAAPASADEETWARRIAGSVGSHPLALDLLGSYMRRRAKTMQRFVSEHPTFERDFLFREELKDWTENAYEVSISNMWTMNISETEEPDSGLSANAKILMNMLAFLDEDGVPLSLFTTPNRDAMMFEGPELLDQVPRLEEELENPFTDPVVFDEARGSLLELSLISLDHKPSNNPRISCHRLVRIAVARSMDPATRSLVFNKLVFFLNAALPTQADGRPLHDKWEGCEELASQVHALLATYKTYQDDLVEPILLTEIVCRCSWYLFEKGQYPAALEMVEEAIAICQRALGRKSHPGYDAWFVRDMISYLVNVQASVCREKPSVDHGLGWSETVCDMRQGNKRAGAVPFTDQDQKWIAAARGNLAVSLMAVGRAGEALEILKELLKREDMRDNEDTYLSNACLCLSMLGRLDEAVEYNELAMAAASRSGNTMQMANCLFYLSGIYRKKGDIQTAIIHLERCLEIRGTLMQGRHLYNGFTLHQMGVLKQRIGSRKDAIRCFVEALEILSTSECHEGAICRTAYALAAATREEGDTEAAEGHRGAAEASRKKIRDVDAKGLGEDPASYDRFVTVGLR